MRTAAPTGRCLQPDGSVIRSFSRSRSIQMINAIGYAADLVVRAARPNASFSRGAAAGLQKQLLSLWLAISTSPVLSDSNAEMLIHKRVHPHGFNRCHRLFGLSPKGSSWLFMAHGKRNRLTTLVSGAPPLTQNKRRKRNRRIRCTSRVISSVSCPHKPSTFRRSAQRNRKPSSR